MKIVGLPFDTNVKCNRCGCEFEIDFTDAIYHETFTTYAKKDHYNSANSFSVLCPLCGQDINLKEKRIKELTEENERLREQAYRLECDLQLNADEKVDAKAIEQTKKTTVKKMQERLKSHFDCDCSYFRISHSDIRRDIDQIAKEILEGV